MSDLCSDNSNPQPTKRLRRKAKDGVGRRKVSCPICNKQIVQLKQHLMVVHKKDEAFAKTARINFGLNIVRSSAKTSRNYRLFHCSIEGCMTVPKRIHSHLKRAHKLTGKKYLYYLQEAKKNPLLDSKDDESTAESSDSSDEEKNYDDLKKSEYKAVRRGERKFTNPKQDLSSDDEDWFLGILSGNEDISEDEDMVSENDLDSDNNDDEADDDGVDVSMIITNKMQDKILEMFKIHLMSLDGGSKKEGTAIAHRDVVLRVVKNMNMDFQNLWNRSEMNKWISESELSSKTTAGTLKAYMGSVKMFLDFLKIKKPIEVPFIEADLDMMTHVLSNWCRSLHRKIRMRKSAKREEDRLRVPLPEEMRKLDSCEATFQASAILDEYVHTGKKIPKLKYAYVRDYLITKIITDNFQRSGVIGNMKIKEFLRAIENDGSFIVSVLEHKTEINGPADIVMEPKLFTMVDRFLKFLRCQIKASESNDFLFISWNGMKMSSSMVTNSLNACWKRSLGDDYRSNVTCSLFRKLGTTTVHQHLPELKQNCAHLMTHSVQVAENEYNVHNKKSTAVKTSEKMKKAVRVDFSVDKGESIIDLFDINDKLNMQNVNDKLQSAGIELDQSAKKKVYDRLRYKQRTRTTDDPCSSKYRGGETEPTSDPEPELYSEPEPEPHVEVEQDPIWLPQPNAETEPKPHVEAEQDPIWLPQTNTEREQEQKQKREPKIESETESEPETTRIKQKRLFYTQDDNAVYRKVLKDWIHSSKQVERKEFYKMLRSKPELKNLVAKFGVEKLRTKLFTERKRI